MISVSADPSLKWAETCDRLRARVPGLPTAAGCFIFPSVEAALIEVAELLSARERETGSGKNMIVYGAAQDPALDRMAQAMSSTGLEAKPKSEADWANTETWLQEIKSKVILIAHAEDDRFTGRVYDTAVRRAAFLKDGLRIPVATLCFESVSTIVLPRPFEIRIYPLDGASAVMAVVGERLRLEPRMAPVSLDPSRLAQIEKSLGVTEKSGAAALEPRDAEKLRNEIEAFESALPPGFQPWWPKGSARMLDRAIITSKDVDGSLVIEKLRADLGKSLNENSLKPNAGLSLFESGLFALSGCAMNDERRQEWLRSRGDDPWLIRGAIHVSRDLIRAVPIESLKSILSSTLSSVATKK